MKISISNIAWDKKDDEQVYQILQKNNIYGVDVAPARVFEQPFEVSNEQGKEFINKLNSYGLNPVGMQSLLFGTSGLALFENAVSRRHTVEHLKRMMDYAQKIGITRLVFGSPKNRLIGNRSPKEVEQLCYDVFNELGDYANRHNLYFCIEPNPIAYGADFITTTKEGIELVKKINNPGFRLHMDLGTMIMNDESIEEVIEEGLEVTEHIHLSHPNLEQVIGLEDTHRRFFEVLKKNDYKKTLAIEMKKTDVRNIKETIEFINNNYKRA